MQFCTIDLHKFNANGWNTEKASGVAWNPFRGTETRRTRGRRGRGGIEEIGNDLDRSLAFSLFFFFSLLPAFFVLARWRCLFQNPSREKIVCDYSTRSPTRPFTSSWPRTATLPRANARWWIQRTLEILNRLDRSSLPWISNRVTHSTAVYCQTVLGAIRQLSSIISFFFFFYRIYFIDLGCTMNFILILRYLKGWINFDRWTFL